VVAGGDVAAASDEFGRQTTQVSEKAFDGA
jgi:hypothetical protein